MTICITGMHRSDTSMVARMLNLCGVYLGESDELMPAHPEQNPEGFWEHMGFVDINQRLLSALGLGWDFVTPLPEGWIHSAALEPLRAEARGLAQRLESHGLWGWKDPRASITWAFWKSLLPNMRTVVCVRNPLDVSDSLTRRNFASSVAGLRLWESYYSALDVALARPDTVVTHYEAFFADPQAELTRVTEALGLRPSPEQMQAACAFVMPGLRHSARSTVDVLALGVPPEIGELYVSLCALGGTAFAQTVAAQLQGNPTGSLFEFATAARMRLLEGRLDALASERASLQTALDESRSALGRASERAMQESLATAALTAEKAELERALERSAAQIELRADEANGLRASMAELEAERGRLELAVTELQGETKRLRAALDGASGLLAQAQTFAAAGDDERRALLARLDERQEEVEALSARIAQIGQAVAWLRRSHVMDVPRWYWRTRLAMRGGDASLRTIPAAQLVIGDTASLFAVPDRAAAAAPARDASAAGAVQGLRQQLQRLASPIDGNLDMPDEGANISEKLHVHGWAHSRVAEIARVELSLDNEPMGSAIHGVQRPDVTAAHPEYGAGDYGFDAYLELPPIEQDTPRHLLVRVSDQAGNHAEYDCRFVQRAPATSGPSRRTLRYMAQAAQVQAPEYGAPSEEGFELPAADLRLIAFYLPQYHPIPQNDAWWGKGFTEWSNVTRAVPQFVGHYQPHLPGELGFYDLRLVDVQQRQIALARQYGIHGFCYYYYWFSGQKLLERPLQQVLDNPDLDFPFCLCWANENWTRRWDGLHNDVLIAQMYRPEDDEGFIRDIEPALRDRRYIHVNGRPLLIVYRPGQLPNAKRTSSVWRSYCRSAGLPNPYLVMAQTFGDTDPRPYGFDAAVEFPPHNVVWESINHQLEFLNPGYEGTVIDYATVVASAETPKDAPYPVLRSVFPMWDNEARKPGRGYTFAHSTPILYRSWLETVARQTDSKMAPGEQLVFINAWNEWAEGAHLEPDRKFGHAYLQATADVLVLRDAARHGNVIAPADGSQRRSPVGVIAHVYYHELWDEIEERLKGMETSFDLYVSLPMNKLVSPMIARIRKAYPRSVIHLTENRGRDMAPFLRIFRDVAGAGYSALCKLHTKRSTHREDGDDWRREVLDGLLSPDVAARAVSALSAREGRIGIIGPASHLVDGNYYWGLNERTVVDLAARLGFDARRGALSFVSGSMFWFKPEALKPLLDLGLRDEDFPPETGQTDGTLAHALERMAPIAARVAGFDTVDTSALRADATGATDGAREYRFARRTR